MRGTSLGGMGEGFCVLCWFRGWWMGEAVGRGILNYRHTTRSDLNCWFFYQLLWKVALGGGDALLKGAMLIKAVDPRSQRTKRTCS